MTNPYFNPTGAPVSQTRGSSSAVRSEFAAVGVGFDALVTALALKGNVGGQTWTGTHTFPSTAYGVTASAESNNLLLATTEYVDRAISVMPSGSLPSVTGKNTTWSLTPNATGTGVQWTQGAGSGGAAITGNTTLTSSSSAAMTVTPTTYGLYATLPDATTCPKTVSVFSFYNAGDYDYGLKDSTGTQLGWIRPKTGAVIGLSDNSTAAGSWVLYGVEKLGVTAEFSNRTITGMNGNCQRVALDANRSCFIFGGTSVYGVVYDASTQTWGSATLIRSGIASGAFASCLSSTNQVLVVSCNSTTAFQAVALTIATNTITVNTAGTATLAGNFSSMGQLIAVGASFVVPYVTSVPSMEIRAMSISGVTVTVGSSTTLVGSTVAASNLYASGSILRCIYQDNALTIHAKPFTVSGTTLTVGTEATAAGTTAAGLRSFQNGNGNIVAEYINTTHFATIFKLTGTTEAASSVSLGTVSTSITQYNDCIAISASKTLFTSVVTGSAVDWYANILTDTNGTASAGTQISGSITGSLAVGLVPFYSSGNVVRAVLYASSNAAQMTFDCSGSSPVLSSQFTRSSTSSGQFDYIQASSSLGTKKSNWLLAGTTMYHLVNVGSGGGSQIGLSLKYSPTGTDTFKSVYTMPLFSIGNVSIGSSNSETYLFAQLNNTTGFAIAKVEAAA